MEGIRERCQQMRIGELQTFLGQNPQYLTACEDIYIQKYKRLYATICVMLIMTKEDFMIRNLSLGNLDTVVAREIIEGNNNLVPLHQGLPAFRDYLSNPETYDAEDENNLLNFGDIKMRVYTPFPWTTDIPGLDSSNQIDTMLYFEAAPFLYAFFYGLIKYNDPPIFEEEETVPLIIQQVMEFV